MSKPANEIDELFDVKNYFYIGSYQQCINEAQKIKVFFQKPSKEKDLYVYRAYIAQRKYRVVMDEIKPNSELGAFFYVAEYFAFPEKRNVVIDMFEQKFSKDLSECDEVWIIAGATVYYNEGLVENALKILNGVDNLECLALQLQCLIKINRLDLAKKTLAIMQEKDDDATLTQLCQAWLNIEIGGDKLQDAYYIFQEFCDKFSSTVLLLNGQAVCFLGQEKFEEAESALRESLEKDFNNYDTLVNSIILSERTDNNYDIINRYLSQLKDSHRDSPLVTDYNKKKSDFDNLRLQYQPSNQTPVTQIAI